MLPEPPLPTIGTKQSFGLIEPFERVLRPFEFPQRGRTVKFAERLRVRIRMVADPMSLGLGPFGEGSTSGGDHFAAQHEKRRFDRMFREDIEHTGSHIGLGTIVERESYFGHLEEVNRPRQLEWVTLIQSNRRDAGTFFVSPVSVC